MSFPFLTLSHFASSSFCSDAWDNESSFYSDAWDNEKKSLCIGKLGL